MTSSRRLTTPPSHFAARIVSRDHRQGQQGVERVLLRLLGDAVDRCDDRTQAEQSADSDRADTCTAPVLNSATSLRRRD